MERCAKPFRTVDPNVSSMFLNDLVYDRQAKTRSLIEGARVFSGKEWVEDVVEMLRRNSLPSIFYFDVCPLLPVGFLESMGSRRGPYRDSLRWHP